MGEIVLLEDQDRSRWDHDMIDEGVATLDLAMELGSPGPYQVQAAIAALHARAPRPEDTDWPQIATLYGALAEMGSVARRRAEPGRGGRDGGRTGRGTRARGRAGARSWTATTCSTPARADLLRRLGRREEAAAAYRRALDLTTNPHERAFLERRLREVVTPDQSGRLVAAEPRSHRDGAPQPTVSVPSTQGHATVTTTRGGRRIPPRVGER